METGILILFSMEKKGKFVPVHAIKAYSVIEVFFFNGSTAPWGPMPPHFSRLHDHTLDTHIPGKTPLDE
jgi:hypothetical protein